MSNIVRHLIPCGVAVGLLLALCLIDWACNRPQVVVGASPYESELQACKRLAEKYRADTEHILPDRTRVDLLNDVHAIEVDWAPKWYEAIGQSLWYSLNTNRRPAVLLLTTPGDERYVERCRQVCDKVGITFYQEEAKLK